MGRLGTSQLPQRKTQGPACWRCSRVAPRRRRQRAQQQPRAALLDPPPFDPSKLRVEYLPGGRELRLPAGRRYTLTHNDVTGSLQLSIGPEYNRRQLDGWYTRMLRDEILAEWRDTPPPVPPVQPPPAASSSGAAPVAAPLTPGGNARSSRRSSSGQPPQPSLHVFCHVSGEELWPAPPQLRSFIFQREMTLVLDTILYADADLLAAAPQLATAPIYVHLASDIPALDRVVEWGVLGNRATWRTARSSVMRSLLSSVTGTIDEAEEAADGSNGRWTRTSFSASSGGSWDGSWGEGIGTTAAAGSTSSWDGSWQDGVGPSASSSLQQQPPPAPPPPPPAARRGSLQRSSAADSDAAAGPTAAPILAELSSQPAAKSPVGSLPATGAFVSVSNGTAGPSSSSGGSSTRSSSAVVKGPVSMAAQQQPLQCSYLVPSPVPTAAAADARQLRQLGAAEAVLVKAPSRQRQR